MRRSALILLYCAVGGAGACILDIDSARVSPDRMAKAQESIKASVLRRPVVRHAVFLTHDENGLAPPFRKEIEEYLTEIGRDVFRLAAARTRVTTGADMSRLLGARVSLPEVSQPKRFSVKIVEQPDAEAWVEGCTTAPTVVLTRKLVTQVALGSFNYGQGIAAFQDQETLVSFLRAVRRPEAINKDGYYGFVDAFSDVWRGAAFEAPTAEGQREYVKAMAFILAHEAAHLWADNCARVPAEKELAADLHGVLVAFELYLGRCNKSMRPLDSAWVRARSAMAPVDRISVPYNLWGRNGIELLAQIYEKSALSEKDQWHAPIEERRQVVEGVAETIVDGTLGAMRAALDKKWFGMFRDSRISLATRDVADMPCPTGEILDQWDQRQHW